MQSNYQYALTQVLKSEGGYTNNPRDPGGPTNFGITIADYRAYVKRNATASDVRRMSLDDAKRIYKSKYWDKVNGDSLPSGVDYCVFDYAVNSGISRALRVYSKYKSLQPADCINKMCDERLSFLKSLRTWSTFGKGWGPRVARVRSDSIRIAKQPSVYSGAPTVVSVGLAGYLTTVWHEYWLWIICAAIGLAISVELGLYFYKRNKK